jgi:hypothetical protein
VYVEGERGLIMKITDTNKVTFSTGKRIYAYGGIVGISEDLGVFGGYDQDFYDYEADYSWRTEPGEDAQHLTDAERVELADYMIERWNNFKGLVR